MNPRQISNYHIFQKVHRTWRDASCKAETIQPSPASLTCSKGYATHHHPYLPTLLPNLTSRFTPQRLSRRRLPGTPSPQNPTNPRPPRHATIRDSFTGCPISRITGSQEKSLCSLHTPPGPGRRYENTLQSIKKPTHHNFSPPVDGLLHADERGRSEAGFGRRLCVELTPDHVSPADGPGCTT
jgi:hypothetical protein